MMREKLLEDLIEKIMSHPKMLEADEAKEEIKTPMPEEDSEEMVADLEEDEKPIEPEDTETESEDENLLADAKNILNKKMKV